MPMDERQKAQLKLTIMHDVDLALRALEADVNEISKAAFAQGGRGGSPVLKLIGKAGARSTNALFDSVVSKALRISTDAEALELIEAAMPTFLSLMQDLLDRASCVSSRQSLRIQGRGKMPELAAAQLDLVQKEVDARIELARFEFSGAQTALSPSQSSARLPVRSLNRGGRLLAAHWDDLWSTMAVQLWEGELDPKCQADIKNAMLDWFADKKINIGETAVTDRARQLWLKMEAAK